MFLKKRVVCVRFSGGVDVMFRNVCWVLVVLSVLFPIVFACLLVFMVFVDGGIMVVDDVKRFKFC